MTSLPRRFAHARPIAVAPTVVAACLAATALLGSPGRAGAMPAITTHEVAAPADATATSGSSLQSIACTSSTFCLSAGRYENTGLFGEQEFSTSTGSGDGTELGFQIPSDDSVTTQSYINASSCPAPSTCTEVGGAVYQGSPPAGWSQPLVESWQDGTPAFMAPPPMPGGLSVAVALDDTLNTVSCATTSSCLVGGSYSQPLFLTQTAFVQLDTDGTWGQPLSLVMPGSTPTNYTVGDVLTSSCWSAGNCEVAGTYDAAAGVTLPFVDAIVDGVPQTPTELPLPAAATSTDWFFGPDGISCPAPGECVAVGGWSTYDAPYAQYPLAWSLADGTWSATPLDLPATPADATPLAGVSCSGPGRCLAVGSSSTTGVPTLGVAYELLGTTWQAPVAIGVPANFSTNVNEEQLLFHGVSCAASGFCAFAGTYVDTSDVSQALVGNVQLDALPVPPSDPTSLVATPGVASATLRWHAPLSDGGSPVTGYTATSSPGALRCTSVGPACRVMGLADGAAYTFTVVAHSAAGTSGRSAASAPVVPGHPSATTLRVSPPSATYGHESSVLLSVTVRSASTGETTAPGGTVVVVAGSRRVCVITLSGAKGSCRLAPKQLALGTYSLTAAFHGSTTYASSTSSARSLRVS